MKYTKQVKIQKYWWGDKFDGNRAISDVEPITNGEEKSTKWKRYFTDQEFLESGTAPVVNKGIRCNDWEICDIAGNLWEWTSDSRYDGFRFIKGGSWYYTDPEWYSYEHESSADPKNILC